MISILPAQRLTIEDVATYNGAQETPDIAPWFGKPMHLWTMTVQVSPKLIIHGTFPREVIEAELAR